MFSLGFNRGINKLSIVLVQDFTAWTGIPFVERIKCSTETRHLSDH